MLPARWETMLFSSALVPAGYSSIRLAPTTACLRFNGNRGIEFTLLLVTVAVAIGFAGPGAYSLDTLLNIPLPLSEQQLFGVLAAAALVVDVIGLIISLLSNNSVAGFEPLMALLLSAFWIYMPFEAYHTAKYRRSGQAVDEVSSLIQVSGSGPRFPVAPIILIALGTLLLLDNLGLLELRRALRYWPALLIAAGVYLLYARLASASREAKR